MFPHLTYDERGERGPNVGIVVVAPNGKRYFFPGATIELAKALANKVFEIDGESGILTHPRTRIEHGLAEGKTWTCLQEVKVPVGVNAPDLARGWNYVAPGIPKTEG